jgi:hypothetical protein
MPCRHRRLFLHAAAPADVTSSPSAMRAVQRAGGGFRIEINRATGNMQLIPDAAPSGPVSKANEWDEALASDAH